MIGQSIKKIRHDTKRGNSTKSFKGYSPFEEANTSEPKPVKKSNDRMYFVDCGVALHLIGDNFSLSLWKRKPYDRQKNYLDIQTSIGVVVSTKEARVYIQVLGTYLYVNQPLLRPS